MGLVKDLVSNHMVCLPRILFFLPCYFSLNPKVLWYLQSLPGDTRDCTRICQSHLRNTNVNFAITALVTVTTCCHASVCPILSWTRHRSNCSCRILYFLSGLHAHLQIIQNNYSFRLGWVHTAPRTNLSVIVDICQPLTLLRFCAKSQIKIPVLWVHTAHSNGRKISVYVALILSQCCGRDRYPIWAFILSTALEKNSVYLNIHFEGLYLNLRFCTFLRGVVWTVSQKRRFWCAF